MRSVFALGLAAALAACGESPALEVSDAWARDTIGSTATAAVFMTVTSPTADRLVAASTPVAANTDLMTMTMTDGAMEMIYLDGIAIPAGEPVALDPAGLHVWLADLRRPLKAGQTFPLTLSFENAGKRRVTVSVIAPSASAPNAAPKAATER